MAEVLSLPIDALVPDPTQPRKTFLKEEIDRLAASIAARGILLPIRVLRDEDRGCWRIVTGESRWRAARIAGLAEVPCLPIEGEVSETDLLADRIVENSVRHDLLPLDLARAIARLKALNGCNSQALAAELGISGPAITRAEALLSLPPEIQAMVDDGRVPESAGYEISRLADDRARHELARALAEGRMTRDAAAAQVRSRLGKRRVTPRAGRLALRHDGLALTLTAAEPLSWERVNGLLDQLRRTARRLQDGGKDVAALAAALNTP